jgi:hypothetical protein
MALEPLVIYLMGQGLGVRFDKHDWEDAHEMQGVTIVIRAIDNGYRWGQPPKQHWQSRIRNPSMLLKAIKTVSIIYIAINLTAFLS